MRPRELPLFGEPPTAPAVPPVAAKGFRPFFLLAGVFAALLVPIWLLALAGVARPDAYFDSIHWHAHEMVFGLATAVVAGFLLTAVANWTGRETLVGTPLLVLAALWILARGALLVPGLPRAVPAALDVAFLPALAISLARPIAASRNRRNYAIVAVVLALAAANAAMHLDVLGVVSGVRRPAALVGVDLIVLLVVVIAGRVVPMFTKNATGDASVRSHPGLDRAAIVATVGAAVVDLVMPESGVAAVAAGAAAALTGARAVHWTTSRVWRVPLLWVLHVGYAWVPIGFALRAASGAWATIPPSLATHALTVGAIGTLVLGMMARVSLGHTGRPLVVGRAVATSFALVTLAAVVRVAGPLVGPSHYRAAIHLAGACWTCAFTIFLVTYSPLLLAPRADGKSG